MRIFLNCGRIAAVAAGALLVACGGDSGGSDRPTPDPLASYKSQTIVWRECQPSILGREGEWPESLGDRVRCADIRVPKDYRAPQQGDLTVAMLRVAAEQPDRKLGALVFNPGGPGADGLGLATHFGALWTGADPEDSLGELYREMSRRYDLVGFSPRGAGASTALVCESNELFPSIAFPSDDRSADNVEKLFYEAQLVANTCKKNPLTPYINTEQTVHDLDLMRHLLDDTRLNYIGYSYGTWLGAWYAARFPERVGRMLLDSNVDFTGTFDDASREQVRAQQRVLDQVLAPYAARHPDRYGLGASADGVRDVFGRLPTPVKDIVSDEIPLAVSHTSVDALHLLKGAAVAGDLILADPDASKAQIDERVDSGGPYAADAGPDAAIIEASHKVVAAYFKKQTAEPEEISLRRNEATYHAVVCNDAPSNPSHDYWVELGDEYALKYPLNGGSLTHQPCLFWGGPNVDKPSISAVADAGTLLMVQSEFDGLTATEGAVAMFDELPTAKLVFVNDEYSHGVFPYGTECVDRPVLRYFNEGQVPVRRTDCAGKPLPGDDDAAAARTLMRSAAKQAQASPYLDPERARALREKIGEIIAGPANHRR